ncbi:transposase [Cryobacterium sp. Y62]|uniref:transposase n=1 Tax=Cryobacterium sp. Y62 TaxID=2048284 RepID=UPI000CE4F3CD|nr:transposase [Cryobacterium sp. Y62]
MTNRRKFSADFRVEAVELVISSGRPIAQVAPEIGVVEGTLGNSVRVWKEKHPEAGGAGEPSPVEWAECKALQAENAELKRESEFLGYPEVRIMPMFA